VWIWRCGGDQETASPEAENRPRRCPTYAEATAGKSLSANWVPSPENRDLRQLLWHRHRLVQMRTRIMNQLQAVAMNEGYRWKKNCSAKRDEHC